MKSGYGEFSGEPKTTWMTEPEPDRYMTLIEAFSFKGKGFDVTAPAHYRINGASIPRALWTLVGSPYTGDYRCASIVHDKACDEAQGDVAKRRAADRMFYYACRAGGCPWWQAVMLYIGVRIGAGLGRVERWQETERSADTTPRLMRSQADMAIERDFGVAASIVLRQCKAANVTDDASEIERRTDEVLEILTGASFRDA